MITFRCPECETVHAAEPYAVGTTRPCWKCGTAILVSEAPPTDEPGLHWWHVGFGWVVGLVMGICLAAGLSGTGLGTWLSRLFW